MAHFYAECSDNLRHSAKLDELFIKVNQHLADTEFFPLGGIRSRAIWLDTWRVADGAHDYAFVHMTLKIGHGRSVEIRQLVGTSLFNLIKEHFAHLMDQRLLALSFELVELDKELNFKSNNIHQFLKQTS